MSMRRSTAQPVEMSVGIGAGLGDFFAVELNGDELAYAYRHFDGIEERATVTPDAEAWRSFRRSVQRLKGWPWQGRFEQPPDQLSTDGVQWEIVLAFSDGDRASCDGYNAFPPDGDGMEMPRSFRSFCRSISRLLGGRYFGWEHAAEPAKAAVKRSQLRIRQWVGEHRERFEQELLKASPSLAAWADGPVKWLSPLPDSGYKEFRDEIWSMVGIHPSPQEKGWWPKRGPVWDAVGVLFGADGTGVVLVEAKSHEAELRSPPSKASYTSLQTIEAAFDKTKAALGVPPDAPWSQTYYQIANRLAMLYWLREVAGSQAWLFNVYFTGDAFQTGSMTVVGPRDAAGWSQSIREAKQTLQLPENHRLSPWVVDVFLPADPARMS